MDISRTNPFTDRPIEFYHAELVPRRKAHAYTSEFSTLLSQSVHSHTLGCGHLLTSPDTVSREWAWWVDWVYGSVGRCNYQSSPRQVSTTYWISIYESTVVKRS